MTLEEWMKKRYGRIDSEAEKEFAALIGVSWTAVIRYLQRGTKLGRVPKPEVMLKIAVATDFEVTPNDLLDIKELRKEAKTAPDKINLAKERGEKFGKGKYTHPCFLRKKNSAKYP